MKLAGLGAFHTAIEVFGIEISYGTPDGTCVAVTCAYFYVRCLYDRTQDVDCWCLQGDHHVGLSTCVTKGCFENYRRHGVTFITFRSAYLISNVWEGKDYDILEHNCHHFCDAMCLQLVRHRIPKRLMAIDKFAKPFKPFLTPSQSQSASKSNSQSLASLSPQEHLERLQIEEITQKNADDNEKKEEL